MGCTSSKQFTQEQVRSNQIDQQLKNEKENAPEIKILLLGNN
jgi:hypothetical protein